MQEGKRVIGHVTPGPRCLGCGCEFGGGSPFCHACTLARETRKRVRLRVATRDGHRHMADTIVCSADMPEPVFVLMDGERLTKITAKEVLDIYPILEPAPHA